MKERGMKRRKQIVIAVSCAFILFLYGLFSPSNPSAGSLSLQVSPKGWTLSKEEWYINSPNTGASEKVKTRFYVGPVMIDYDYHFPWPDK
jgi:hypothetical protein